MAPTQPTKSVVTPVLKPYFINYHCSVTITEVLIVQGLINMCIYSPESKHQSQCNMSFDNGRDLNHWYLDIITLEKGDKPFCDFYFAFSAHELVQYNYYRDHPEVKHTIF
jgi:hypothetical protein